jgi:D-alanyl-D-alanine carboxypeptidase
MSFLKVCPMNKTKHKLFASCLVLFLLSPAAFAQSDKAKKIDSLITPFAVANQFSGVVLASENGKVIYEKASLSHQTRLLF